MRMRTAFFPDAGIEVRQQGGSAPRIGGYALRWMQEARLFGETGRGAWLERFEGGAFKSVLKDVGLNVQHSNIGLYLARTTSGDLSLREDDKGLAWEAELDPSDPEHVSVYRRALRGVPGGVSVAYLPTKRGRKQELRDNGDIVETITRVKIFPDISIVNRPAYHSSSVEVRFETMEDKLDRLDPELRERREEALRQTSRETRPTDARARAIRARSLSKRSTP